MSDDLDRQLEAIATAAQASVRVTAAETEHALADVTGGARVTRLRPVDSARGRGLELWIGVAAATALVATGGIWLLTRGPERITTTLTVPAPTADEVVTVAPTPPSEPLTTSPASSPGTVAPRDPFAGLVREDTGIERTCYSGAECTVLLTDPYGGLYSCDPRSHVVRQLADDGSPMSETALDSCPMLIGPEAVAYLSEPVDPERPDLVAVSLREGAELRRWPDALDASGDSDYVATPVGIVAVGCCGLGMAAELADPSVVFEWAVPEDGVIRSFDIAVFEQDLLEPIESEPALVAHGQRWPVGEHLGEVWVRGAVWAVPTSDGGVVAVVRNERDLTLTLFRGESDRSLSGMSLILDGVEHLPAALERSGTIILPEGDTFTRVDPRVAFAPTTEPPLAPVTTAPAVDLVEAFAGLNWESTTIERACGDVWWEQQQVEQRRCTELVVDPNGVPVSYDPVSRLVTRERREGDALVAFVLPDEYVDAALLAAGPDDVVYFTLDNGWPEAADVIALSLAPGDAGRLVERFPEALGVGDADVLPTMTGLVVSGWYAPGFRPAADAVPAVPWVSREGGDPPTVPSGQFDDAGSRVNAAGWQWSIVDRGVTPGQPGTSRVVPTFDGGFLALYSETVGDLRGELIRGWRDGTVEYAELPVSWSEFDGTLVLEPQGTVLVPSGDRFVRLAPFAERSTGWDGRLEVDVEAGTAIAVGLDEYLDTIDWPVEGQSHVWPWGTSLTSYANAVAGPVESPATLRTIEIEHSDAQYAVIVVTDENLLDDSVYGVRLRVIRYTSSPDGGVRAPDSIVWANTCQPGRGHQDYQAAYCT